MRAFESFGKSYLQQSVCEQLYKHHIAELIVTFCNYSSEMPFDDTQLLQPLNSSSALILGQSKLNP